MIKLLCAAAGSLSVALRELKRRKKVTKFEVTPKMVYAALARIKRDFEASPFENFKPAIQAAIDASGLVEENERLRERADKLEACIKAIQLGHNTGKFEPLQMAIEFAEQFINKEPTK